MKKSFVIIGLGRFGSVVAKSLDKMNCDLVAIDINEEAVNNVAKQIPHVVIADSTKLSVLQDLGVASVDHAIVCIGNNLQASILTVLNLKKLNVPNITVRADEVGHKEVFLQLGATDVIIPEEASAISLSNHIISDSILDYYELAKNHAIIKVSVGKNFDSTQNLIELDVRNRFDVNIVGIIRNDEFMIPRGTDTLNPKDIVAVIGTPAMVRKFDTFLNS